MSTIDPDSVPKPCPFCGSLDVKAVEAGPALDGEDKNHYAQCQNCSSDGPWARSAEEAIGRWNHRHNERDEFCCGAPEYQELLSEIERLGDLHKRLGS